MTLIARGSTACGFVPADHASMLSPFKWRAQPSAIWLRHEFPVQRKSIFFLSGIVAPRTFYLLSGILYQYIFYGVRGIGGDVQAFLDHLGDVFLPDDLKLWNNSMMHFPVETVQSKTIWLTAHSNNTPVNVPNTQGVFPVVNKIRKPAIARTTCATPSVTFKQPD
jgi:hypothetical protein